MLDVTGPTHIYLTVVGVDHTTQLNKLEKTLAEVLVGLTETKLEVVALKEEIKSYRAEQVKLNELNNELDLANKKVDDTLDENKNQPTLSP